MPQSEAAVRAAILAMSAFVSWSLLIGEALHARALEPTAPNYGALIRSVGKE